MTWAAPIDRAISTFLVLHTAVTSAPKSSGNLHGKCTHTTRCAFNKNLVPWLHPSFVTKSLQGCACRNWHRCRVFKRQVGRLRSHFSFHRTDVLCKSLPMKAC